MELISYVHVNKSFGKKQVLHDIHLTLPRGKIIGLLGKNGMGKSTMIKLINDLLVPTSGQVLIEGKAPGVESKEMIAYLPERTYLDKTMTVERVLDYFADFYSNFDREKALQLLTQLDLDPKEKLSHMSKGMQEKVQLVLVMSRRAKLYLLDEPIGGVDPAARDYILQTIITNYDPEAAVVISTHLIADVEQVLDHFVFVHQGRIVRSGSVDAAREATGLTIDELFREVFRCL